MSGGQSQEEPRLGIFGSLASIINSLPLISRPQSDQVTQRQSSSGGTNNYVAQPPGVPSESSSSNKDTLPSRSIPGRWDSVDYIDAAAVTGETSPMGHVTATENRPDHRVPEVSTHTKPEPLRPILENSNNSLANRDVTITFPEPQSSPRDGGVGAHPYSDLNLLALLAQSSSGNESPLPRVVEQVIPDKVDKSSAPSMNIPQKPDPTQTTLLRPPATSTNNHSQDRLSVSSTGAESTHSSGKKKVKNFWNSTKTLFRPVSPGTPTSKLQPPITAPPSRIRAAVAFEKQDATLDVLDSNLEYFQNVELHSSTTWEDICRELLPLPAFNQILTHLNGIFAAVENIRTYHGQWRRLRGNCIVVTRLLAHQYERYQAEPERLILLGKVCDDLGTVVAEISLTARKWSGKGSIEAFVYYESMDKALRIHFQALSDVLKAMESTSRVLNETWASEIARSQKMEREEIAGIHATLQQHSSSLAQLTQAIQLKDALIAQLIGENEKTIKQLLGQKMDQFQQAGEDAEDIDKLIQTIVQITGVQLPTEVFQTEPCTTIPDMEPIHGHSSTVYKAKLARGQSVAKKIFYLNKYSEGDVKTYAVKMVRDAKQWRVFESEYTLKCLGIGMEQTNDKQFKLYMISPWMENMDTVADSALGLVEIHRKSSVHSNMRAQNVLVRANGRGILGGFGLTKALKNHTTGKLPSVEQTGQSLPYRWMAPECHSYGPGRPDVTVANDVWGWAMTALEIITGVPPIRQISGDMALPCAKPEEFDISKQRKEYPEWEKYAHKPDLLWALLSKCWSLDATKRPDMQTVSDEVEKIIAQP
ncbi:Putative leucine-rich repeat-containing protein DDB_G0290503 [Dictyostelium discoideum] [Rhizoctonia solani]|uniref:Putative leucine-rich repeat-containing protein DDB_G0290503 [Dictyostelium discoideum] n=1 Tax=Rhizoctonia solani TaxID=456999 RepID=A0A0K6FLK6_9AGAM|nr:Putative leucine-rich repeat-containing protein DDB_G0290503 [Dictyostelium discoideum] [Rhizoctonia solani]